MAGTFQELLQSTLVHLDTLLQEVGELECASLMDHGMDGLQYVELVCSQSGFFKIKEFSSNWIN